jgi:hypothetical protein
MNHGNRIIESPKNDDSQDDSEIVIFPKDDDYVTPSAITSNPLQQFLKAIPQMLHKGGTPAALIMALGAIAIPLALLQSNLIAGILAGGAVTVAVIYTIGAIIYQSSCND